MSHLLVDNIRCHIEEVDDWQVIWNLSERVFPKDLLSQEALSRADRYQTESLSGRALILFGVARSATYASKANL